MVTIRLACPEDRETILRVHVASIRELAKEHYSPRQIAVWSGMPRPGNYDAAIAAGRLYVAEEEGEVVGFGAMGPAGGEVWLLYVSPAHARRGVGTHLMRAMEQVARDAGLRILHLRASLNAVRFYERVGFRRQREVIQSFGGTAFRCVLMEKELAP